MSSNEIIISPWSSDFSLDFGQFSVILNPAIGVAYVKRVILNPAMGVAYVKRPHGGDYEDRLLTERMIDENDLSLMLLV